MIGAFHDFVLLTDDGNRHEQYARHVRDPSAVRVADDLLMYLNDTLRWVPTENPALADLPSGYGLNYYGPTSIAGEGARLFADLLTGWAELFACGPEILLLRGGCTMVEGDAQSHERVQLRISRDTAVRALRSVAAMARQAAEPGFWLLHLGV
jgi:hypothetical protein